MGQTGYRVLTLDLSSAAARTELIPPNNQIAGIRAGLLPVGADIRLHLGNGDGIPLLNAGEWLELEGDALDDGLFWTNAAVLAPGNVSLLLVTFQTQTRTGSGCHGCGGH